MRLNTSAEPFLQVLKEEIVIGGWMGNIADGHPCIVLVEEHFHNIRYWLFFTFERKSMWIKPRASLKTIIMTSWVLPLLTAA